MLLDFRHRNLVGIPISSQSTHNCHIWFSKQLQKPKNIFDPKDNVSSSFICQWIIQDRMLSRNKRHRLHRIFPTGNWTPEFMTLASRHGFLPFFRVGELDFLSIYVWKKISNKYKWPITSHFTNPMMDGDFVNLGNSP